MTDSNGQSRGEIVLYQTPDGTVELDVRLERESLWLSINQMASLFERDKSVISRHLRKVFQEGELDRGATVAKNATVQMEGTREVPREVELLNEYRTRLTADVVTGKTRCPRGSGWIAG